MMNVFKDCATADGTTASGGSFGYRDILLIKLYVKTNDNRQLLIQNVPGEIIKTYKRNMCLWQMNATPQNRVDEIKNFNFLGPRLI